MSSATLVAAEPRAAAPVRPARRLRLPGYPAGVAALTGVGLVYRVALLGRLPYWRDEAFTAVAARGSWTAMFATVRQDSAPPLGYILDHLASSVSASPLSLRMVSALAGTAAVPVAAALGRRAGGNRAGVFAAAVTAVTPALVGTARDVRMYSLAITLVLLAGLTLVRALERPGAGRLAVHALVVALAVHTHYLTGLAVLAMVAAGLLLRPGPAAWWRAAAATAAGGLTLVPWLIAARAQFQHTGFWIPPLSLGLIQDVLTEFLRGPRLAEDVTLSWTIQAGALAAGALGLAVAPARARSSAPAARRQTAFLAAAGLGGVVALLLISTRRPLFDARYASVLWAPLIPVVGIGLAGLRPRPAAAALVAVLGLSTATILVTIQRQDWPAIATWLDARVGPGDELVINSPDYLLLVQYADPATVARTRVLNHTGPPWYWGTAAYPPGAVVRSLSPGPRVIEVANTFAVPYQVPPGYQRSGPTECIDRFCITPFTR